MKEVACPTNMEDIKGENNYFEWRRVNIGEGH